MLVEHSLFLQQQADHDVVFVDVHHAEKGMALGIDANLGPALQQLPRRKESHRVATKDLLCHQDFLWKSWLAHLATSPFKAG